MVEEVEVAEKVLIELVELKELIDEGVELQGYFDDACQEQADLIASHERTITDLKNVIQDLYVTMKEKNPQLTEHIAQAKREIDALKSGIKAMCHQMPIDQLKAGLLVKGSNMSVSVSRTSVKTSYRSAALIKAHPELLGMKVDGDSVVSRTVDPAILGRLVADGNFNEEVAKKFRIETKLRNPQVRITETKEES